LWAESGDGQIVFDVEHWLVLLDERYIDVALFVFEALFIDTEIERTHQIGQLVSIVLQTNREPFAVSIGSEPTVVNELIVVSDVETAVLSVTVDVIRIDRVAAFLHCQIHAVLHDRGEG